MLDTNAGTMGGSILVKSLLGPDLTIIPTQPHHTDQTYTEGDLTV